MKDWPWQGYLILALILFGLFFFLYYKPKSNDLKILREERIKTEEEVVMLKAKKKELDKIEAELKVLDITLKELEAVIPQKKEISDILKKIQQLAFDSRLNIVKFIPKGEVDREIYLEWPIAIELTGNYHNLAIFFDRLRNFSRLFYLEDFSIKSLRNQTEAATISAACTATTYIFRDTPLPQEGSPEETRN
ncbi:type 4a pilus biogenesis protein PilO [Acidobacteriota bacterium]